MNKSILITLAVFAFAILAACSHNIYQRTNGKYIQAGFNPNDMNACVKYSSGETVTIAMKERALAIVSYPIESVTAEGIKQTEIRQDVFTTADMISGNMCQMLVEIAKIDPKAAVEIARAQSVDLKTVIYVSEKGVAVEANYDDRTGSVTLDTQVLTGKVVDVWPVGVSVGLPSADTAPVKDTAIKE